MHVFCKTVGGVIPAGAVLLQSFHHDPVDLALHQCRQLRRLRTPRRGDAGFRLRSAESGTRARRFFVADDPKDFIERGQLQPLFLDGRAAGEEFVQQHAEGVYVGARVHVELVERGLLRGHVRRRADERAEAGVNRVLGELLPDGLGHAEVDDFRHRRFVVQGHEDVGRLDVAVDDPLHVGVLDGLAHGDEQFQPLLRGQLAGVAELGDRRPLHQFHDEVRAAVGSGAGVEHLGDVRVVHDREGLPLGLETAQHTPRIHAGLDELEGDPPLDRFELIRDPDFTHAPFTDLFEQFVRPDAVADARRRIAGHRTRRVRPGPGEIGRWPVEGVRLGECPEQALDAPTLFGIADAVDVRSTCREVGDGQGFAEERFVSHGRTLGVDGSPNHAESARGTHRVFSGICGGLQCQ